MASTDRLHEEAVALWIETFGEPPAAHLKGREVLDALFRKLETPDYSQLAQARAARNLTWPRKRA